MNLRPKPAIVGVTFRPHFLTALVVAFMACLILYFKAHEPYEPVPILYGREFGVIGDGRECSAAFNRLMQAAARFQNSIVEIGAGTYYLTNDIVIASNTNGITLRGFGRTEINPYAVGPLAPFDTELKHPSSLVFGDAQPPGAIVGTGLRLLQGFRISETSTGLLEVPFVYLDGTNPVTISDCRFEINVTNPAVYFK